MDPAVEKSARSMETVMDVASSTATSNRPCRRLLIPLHIYGMLLMTFIAVLSQNGKSNFLAKCLMIVVISLSSNSALSSLPV